MRSPLPANMRTYGDILPLQLTHVLHKPSSRACSLFSSTSFLPILHASTPTVTTTHFAKHPPTMKRPPPYQFIKVFGVLPQKQHNCGSVCKSERYASAGEPSRGRLTQRLSWLAREVWYCSASGSSQGGLTGQRFGQFAERLSEPSRVRPTRMAHRRNRASLCAPATALNQLFSVHLSMSPRAVKIESLAICFVHNDPGASRRIARRGNMNASASCKDAF